MLRFTALALILCAPAIRAETAVQHLLENKMFSKLKEYDSSIRGALGVATIDLTSGRVFVYNGEAVFPTASAIKIPIMVEMFRAASRGQFNLGDTLTLTPSDSVPGSGGIQKELLNGPVKLSVIELIKAMIEHSDNTATNRAIALVKMERVNALLSELGFRTIRLRRVMMDSAAAQRGDENTASPIEMARLLEMLQNGKLAKPADTQQMIGILKLVKAGIRQAVPPSVEVASKPGNVPGVGCEAGIVYLPNRPFILSVFSSFHGEGGKPVVEVTKIVYEYFAALAQSNEYGHRVR